MPLYAGVCETNITPPPGVWMSGYAYRPTGCVGVNDELFARALVLDNGHCAVAILSMDLIGLDFDLVKEVKEGIAQQTGLAPEAVMLNASHTHGGPAVREYHAMGPRDPAYIDVLRRKLIGVAKQAASQMRRASIAYGRSPVQIGVNRRQVTKPEGRTVLGANFAGPVAPFVDVLAIRDSREVPFAMLFCHACHPTTLGGENLLITADFCGYACDYVRRETNGSVMPLFLQGCCGNINPYPRGLFSHAQEHGRNLGAAALEALKKSESSSGSDAQREVLDFAERTITLPLQPPPPREECEARIAEWSAKVEEERARGHQGALMHAEGMRDYAQYELRMHEYSSWEQPFTLQRLTIGNAQILGMPAEMFVQYALDFAQQCQGPLLSLGFTNGVHGYVPTAADYPLGGYEVNYAHRYYGTLMFTPDCERLIREAAYGLLGVEEPDWTPYTV